MTKELENLISLLKSPIKENRDLGAIVAQNYEEEFKAHFGFGMKLIEFIFIMKDGYSNKSEIHKCMTKELENFVLLLKSPRKKNRDLAVILAKNHKEEFKAHFGYEIAFMIFLVQNTGLRFDIPFNKIEWLRFYSKDISSIPKDISMFENLTSLTFMNDSLSIFPTEILQLSHLKTLYFSRNQIKVLPPEIRQLKELGKLRIDTNQLQSLPKEIGDLQKLMSLILCNNQLKSLPKEIGDLQKLTTLVLDNNQFKSLPKELAQIKTLEKISIEGNPKNIIIPDELRHIVDVGRGLL